MRVIARRTLKDFWQRHAEAEQPLKAWFRTVEAADWRGPADVKAAYASASFLRENRVCFDIGGNKYRLIVRINYPYRVVYIRFIGTHRDYDGIDANTV